jgi:hypothetical protein
MTNGIKHDNEKLPYFIVLCNQFPDAINAVIQRSYMGHLKYEEFDKDWKNWERVENGYETYSNALLRHLFKEGEDSDLEHDIAVAWNALARLQIRLKENEENSIKKKNSPKKSKGGKGKKR